ncbi:MAG: hypothetical protein ABI560_11190 [Myxococcales bacterium]
MIRHHTRPTFAALWTILTAGVGLASCGSSNSADKVDVPPSGATAIEAWLTAGSYKEWKCESAVHASRDPSPHGFNRICSNSAISNAAGGTGAWPVDSAAVKELYAAIDAPTPVGYAVYRKTTANSAGGTNWYWYERVPLDHPAPHDAAGVVADGMGSSGPAMTICVGCHNAAGADAAHTPSVGGRDQVYTPVL